MLITDLIRSMDIHSLDNKNVTMTSLLDELYVIIQI